MIVRTTMEFKGWFAQLGFKAKRHIDDRLDRIREHNHFGDKKYLGDDLFELRWANGRRVYYTVVTGHDGNTALMLLGGSKDGQNRDIAQARQIMVRQAS
jgi:putative addiction module killer protein